MLFNTEHKERAPSASARSVMPDINLRFWLVLLIALFSLSTLALSQSAPQQATAQTRAAEAQKALRIPIELNGNHIFIQGRVNNSEPLWFTLDTGASISVINTRRARELGLQPEGNFQATGAGGTVESSRLRGITFSLPGTELKNLAVMAIPLDSIENSAGRSMDVILGAELFRRYVVEIDYTNNFIMLYEPEAYTYNGTGEILPLKFSSNHPYVQGKIVVPGLEPIEGDFVIDAGSNFGLTLIPSFIEKHRMMSRVPKTIETRARGVGGEFLISIGRIKGLGLGRFTLQDTITAFPQRGFFGREGAAGNIGGLILRRFKVIFDYSRKRMILEPNKHFSEPMDYDMSGMTLLTDSPQFKLIKINRVIVGSPAAEAGLKPEDVILEVDGRTASRLTLHSLREMFKKEGREYLLKIKRGEELVQVRLKTRRLI